MMRMLGTVIMALVTIFFCMHVSYLPTIGDPESPANSHITPRYIEDGQAETGSPNLVTGVLADYRGFDTLGEATVMFVAGATTVALLKTGKRREDFDQKEEDQDA